MPKGLVKVEIDTEPLYMRITALNALLALQQELRTDERLYHDCLLLLRKVQRAEHGPLTDTLEVLVGRE